MITELWRKDVTRQAAEQYVTDGMDDYYLDPEGWCAMLDILSDWPSPYCDPDTARCDLQSWADYMMDGPLDKVCSCDWPEDPISTAYGFYPPCPRHGGGRGF